MVGYQYFVDIYTGNHCVLIFLFIWMFLIWRHMVGFLIRQKFNFVYIPTQKLRWKFEGHFNISKSCRSYSKWKNDTGNKQKPATIFQLCKLWGRTRGSTFASFFKGYLVFLEQKWDLFSVCNNTILSLSEKFYFCLIHRETLSVWKSVIAGRMRSVQESCARKK